MAVGAVQVAMPVHTPGVLGTVIFNGQPANTGGSVSITVTLNEHVTEFPLTSVAKKLMVVTPIGKADPLGKPAVWETSSPGQLSVAVGAVQVAMAVHWPGSVGMVILAGHDVNTGVVASVTVTVKLQVEELPAASVAV